MQGGNDKGVGRVLPLLIFSLLYHSATLALPSDSDRSNGSNGRTPATDAGLPLTPKQKPQPSSSPSTPRKQRGASSSSSSSSPTATTAKEGALFVVCSVDGSIYALDAWSGQFLSSSRSGAPLLTRTMVNNKDDNDDDEDKEYMTSSVIPGLDGKLYWQPNSDTADHEEALQPLPISIPSLLEHPVRSCTEDGQNCGILTAVAHTTLLALDTETGDISWSTSAAAQSFSTEDETKSESPTVLLQRKDFAIQQFSTKSGKELWNVTLGSYQAVDFEPPVAKSDPMNVQKIDDDDDLSDDFIHDDEDSDTKNGSGEGAGKNPILPSLVLGMAAGNFAPLASTPKLASKPFYGGVESPHVLTSVFGIHNHRWRAVRVLEDRDDWGNPLDDDNTIPYTRRLPAQAAPAEMDYAQLWRQHHSPDQQHNAFVASWHREDANPRAQRALPSSFGNTEQAICLAGGECPRPYDPTTATALLGLPAPSPDTEFSGGNIMGPKQQFTPSHFVALLVCVSVLLFVALEFKRRLKQPPVPGIASPALDAVGGNRTMTQDRPNGSIHETKSFPGAIRTKHHEDARNFPLRLGFDAPPAPVQSDPGEHVEEQGEDPTVNNARPSPNPHFTTGGIPLVQYSRYASEFEEKEALGRGGFGSVFRCRNNLDGRDYAIKKVTIRGIKAGDDASFQQELSRVLREVKILAMLDHGNIVRYYTAWLEMEQYDKDEKTNRENRYSQETSRSLGRSYNMHDSQSTASSIWQASSSTMTQDQSTSSWNGHFRGSKFASSPKRSWQNYDMPSHLDDCGIIFEDSSGVAPVDAANARSEHISESRDSASTREESEMELNVGSSRGVEKPSGKRESTTSKTAEGSDEKAIKHKHTLYIQMELCNIDTVADFLANKKARETFPTTSQRKTDMVNISTALALLLQIAKAVDYVHGKGLIHRDLKPSNCFMDKLGVVKVGDFGLSRETSSDQPAESAIISSILSDIGGNDEGDDAFDDDHTAGVGTRLYASPEQTEGSSYDSSTDVFSLGIMLFELCYPMYTGMERNICLTKLRQQLSFPSDWDAVVGCHASSIKKLLLSMLERKAFARPTASGVVQQIKDLMGELTILSPTTLTNTSDLVLLRVESTCKENPLQDAINHINEASRPYGKVDILQSGMARENERVTVMEFAMQSSTVDGAKLVKHLEKVPQVLLVREVSNHHGAVDYDTSSGSID
eukprot:CAMPEP_0168731760 /NCGR_PEP_ID=MMETSP0724-20121128/7426_1 /TAXON_ID=265536 /ORGANISM="Amphiprora sp., Strain CCMP467" /LENGTH=1205 /DNA_ID=CAMNT_0008778767 /DNA_START=45 /DNA_END=3663 /DNA_ORIENTATION=+